MTCRVEFICNNDQKIIIPFTLHEDGTLEYKIDTEPKITDPKIDLGLGGMLMERFLTSLYEPTSEMSNSDNSVDGN
jgi:hypothetical protein